MYSIVMNKYMYTLSNNVLIHLLIQDFYVARSDNISAKHTLIYLNNIMSEMYLGFNVCSFPMCKGWTLPTLQCQPGGVYWDCGYAY